ncbi:uncharacterized protein L969DRAFT_103449 [Mixia osmundae IAM 14324]|uniref:Uncharacterized protein n=1 Tax=Mixia osmundae (strain CBS 9802 / IAM 14324 / JCM 22182 / KY 12970) TaxID=764103 RepID=G7DVK4_MIXOS|nr:uncharacterized protein L969DRAFT_103449 [Mixia osmundae IAM 14324]KEI39543.1 hypothetical protein L969DRAFT_103449 [Mixia osmundae IAM 14324]GAA94614.1 hypothetical protein E5Q_01266 [Mixia osmundae IAM 14324]
MLLALAGLCAVTDGQQTCHVLYTESYSQSPQDLHERFSCQAPMPCSSNGQEVTSPYGNSTGCIVFDSEANASTVACDSTAKVTITGDALSYSVRCFCSNDTSGCTPGQADVYYSLAFESTPYPSTVTYDTPATSTHTFYFTSEFTAATSSSVSGYVPTTAWTWTEEAIRATSAPTSSPARHQIEYDPARHDDESYVKGRQYWPNHIDIALWHVHALELRRVKQDETDETGPAAPSQEHEASLHVLARQHAFVQCDILTTDQQLEGDWTAAYCPEVMRYELAQIWVWTDDALLTIGDIWSHCVSRTCETSQRGAYFHGFLHAHLPLALRDSADASAEMLSLAYMIAIASLMTGACVHAATQGYAQNKDALASRATGEYLPAQCWLSATPVGEVSASLSFALGWKSDLSQITSLVLDVPDQPSLANKPFFAHTIASPLKSSSFLINYEDWHLVMTMVYDNVLKVYLDPHTTLRGSTIGNWWSMTCNSWGNLNARVPVVKLPADPAQQ